MSINRKELEEIADLAQLNIPDEQINRITDSLNQVMNMIEHINDANTDRIKPMSNPNDSSQIIRNDEVTDESHKQALLNLAAHTDDDHFLVPKVIE